MGKNKKPHFRQVKLNQIFECEYKLYAIAIQLTANGNSNLSGGRSIFEFIKLYSDE
jgi:hypothetical protein